MTRLLLADLRHHAGTWTWTAVVAVVAGACVSGQLMVMRGSLASARAVGDANLIEAASVVSAFIIVSVVFAAATVLTSTSALAVTERERDHGLWRALGMRPGTLRAVVLGQLVAIGAFGALAGTAVGAVVARLMIPLLIEERVTAPGTAPQWVPVDLLWSALIFAGSVVIGGWGAARRASRAPEVALLRGRGDEERRWDLARVLGLLLRLAAVGGLGAGLVSAAGYLAWAGGTPVRGEAQRWEPTLVDVAAGLTNGDVDVADPQHLLTSGVQDEPAGFAATGAGPRVAVGSGPRPLMGTSTVDQSSQAPAGVAGAVGGFMLAAAVVCAIIALVLGPAWLIGTCALAIGGILALKLAGDWLGRI